MKFADYVGMLAESVEELTFEKLKKELKAGKNFNWKNKGYCLVLDKNGKVLVGHDVGGKKENWVGIDKDNFEEYKTHIFAGNKEELTFEKLKEELKAGKKFNWKHKGFELRLKSNKVMVWDWEDEVWFEIDKKDFQKYAKDIFEDGKKMNEAKEELPDYSKANVSKIVSALKNPLPLLTSRDRLNEVEKEKFDDFIMLALNYFINGKIPKEATELDKEILEKLGFSVSGKTKEGTEIIYTRISK